MLCFARQDMGIKQHPTVRAYTRCVLTPWEKNWLFCENKHRYFSFFILRNTAINKLVASFYLQKEHLLSKEQNTD